MSLVQEGRGQGPPQVPRNLGQALTLLQVGGTSSGRGQRRKLAREILAVLGGPQADGLTPVHSPH